MAKKDEDPTPAPDAGPESTQVPDQPIGEPYEPDTDEGSSKADPFKSMTKNELVDQAHSRGIVNPEGKTKAELIEEINDV